MSTGVYLFDEAAKTSMTKYDLGGKGYGLVEMTKLSLPVPDGVIITTQMCNEYFRRGKTVWPELEDEILSKAEALQERTGKRFGDSEKPLLVSVRSGAPFSMPGMMDTILNLGINDAVAESIAKKTGDERFTYDTYRRFMQLFGKIVMGIDGKKFDEIVDAVKSEKGAKSDIEVTAEGWKEVVTRYKRLVKGETGRDIPQDPLEQLMMSVGAVFNSWWNQRAGEYRKIYAIPDSLGTAVNIVTMVYGNLDDRSGTGVAFTRNPSTGERKFYGEFLMKAHGEDVVAGIRTPYHIDKLKELMPDAYATLIGIADKLEKHFRDMQDIEFTIESGRLYMLQTRTGKRTASAAVNIAVDMAGEGLITKEEAILRVEPEQLQRLLYKQVDPGAKITSVAKGLPASPGAAVGKVVFTVEDAKRGKDAKERTILVRPETTPEDIAGIAASDGVLTSRGGMTSHAAVVTRGMGKPCIVGAEGIVISPERGVFTVAGKEVRKGDVITVDGGSGAVYIGEVPLVEPSISDKVATVLKWADRHRRLGIRANADTPEMAMKARENGAEGIGLLRTERMFNAPDRLLLVQKMILADSVGERKRYLDEIKPLIKKDFEEIFGTMGGLPVTIRLLDLPLHEFLPKIDTILPEVVELRLNGKSQAELKEKERVLGRVMELREYNPMMGQRGVRLSLMYPEIYEMQVAAVFEAMEDLRKKGQKAPEIEIMISQIAEAEEFKKAREIVERTATAVTGRKEKDYKVGTMIETPRAALTAAELARVAEFFSFGTNDLTQATFAFSRDDVETKFIPFYLENKVLERNPFESIDVNGVGRLVQMGTSEGKGANKDLKVGICGEHGGDPASIEFFDNAGLDYVSCSPYRVPVARLAAAQSALKGEHGGSTTA